MTRAHRTAHRAIFAVLAVALPALLAAGIGLRPRVPPVSDDTTLFRAAGFAQPRLGPEVEIGIDGLRFALSALDRGDIGIRPLAVMAKPDLLVYWTARPPRDDDLAARLDDAELVGSLSGRSRRLLRLRDRADRGYLLIYSLGYGELLADLPLAELDPATINKTTVTE